MAHSTFISEKDFFAAFDEHADAIFRHCYLRTQSRETAKDLTQAAFTRLWDFIAAGNYVDSLKMFLFRISHELIEQERKKGMLSHEPASETTVEHSPDFSVLGKMDIDEQPTILLYHIDGFSVQDIGRIIGGSSETHDRSLTKWASVLLTA